MRRLAFHNELPVGPSSRKARRGQWPCYPRCISSGKTVSINDAPPSTAMTWPVIQLASSEQSSDTALPMSAGVPRRPAGVQPLFWQRIQHTVFNRSATDGVYSDAALAQRHRKVAAQRFERSLCRPHGDPRLPTSRAATGSVSNGDDSSAVAHQSNRLARGHQKRLSLGIHCHVPILERNVQRLAIERRKLGARVAHEDVQLVELLLDSFENAADVLDPRHVRLNDEAVGPGLLHPSKGVFGRGLILIIMDGHASALLRQLQSDTPADAPRASGN